MSDFTPAQQEPNQSVWDPPPATTATTETPPLTPEQQQAEAGARYKAAYGQAQANSQDYPNPFQVALKYTPVVGNAMDAADCGYYAAQGEGGEAAVACTSTVLGAAGAETAGMALNVGMDLNNASSAGSSPPVSMSTVDGKPVNLNLPGTGSITEAIAAQTPADANFSPANPNVLPYKASGEPGADELNGVSR
jgi:hypothetical protein